MYGEDMLWSECLCSPPNLVVEIQIPNVMVLGGGPLGGDGVALLNGISALRKERCTELPCYFHHMRYNKSVTQKRALT